MMRSNDEMRTSFENMYAANRCHIDASAPFIPAACWRQIRYHQGTYMAKLLAVCQHLIVMMDEAVTMM